MLYLYTILSIPGTDTAIKGIEDAMHSDSRLMNGVLGSIIFGILILGYFAMKYMITKNKEAIAFERESFAKETAINEGAHQNVVKAKDDQIKHLIEENQHFKEKLEEIAKDNTEIYQQLVQKVGSFVEGQAVLSGQVERIKAELLLEIMKIFNTNKN